MTVVEPDIHWSCNKRCSSTSLSQRKRAVRSRVRLQRSRRNPCSGSRGRSIRCHNPRTLASHDDHEATGHDKLVDYQSIKVDLHRSGKRSASNQSILLFKVRSELGTIMSSVAFCSQVEPEKREVKPSNSSERQRAYCRLSYCENSWLSKRTWNACHTKGAAETVLVTVSVP